MNKKVTFLISTISNGGAESVCVNIVNGLAEKGWDVDLVVLHTKQKSYIERLSGNVNLVDLKVSRARYAGPVLLKYLLLNKTEKIVVFKYELIDLVVILKKLFRLDLKVIGRNISILSEVGALQKPSLLMKIIKLLFGTPLESLDCVICQSFEMQKDLLSLLPSLREKSVVIHNPVSYEIEKYVADNCLKERVREGYILCVGRLEKVKAFHYAIDAFALVSEEYPNLRLKFVGEGKLEGALKEQVESLNLKDRVDFVGFQKDVIPYYKSANLTLLTSAYEGFPNVLIESICMNTPVVSFDCPSGPREILEYGKWGKLVPVNDVDLLKVAIIETLKAPSTFDLESRAKFFSIDKAIEKYIKLLN